MKFTYSVKEEGQLIYYGFLEHSSVCCSKMQLNLDREIHITKILDFMMLKACPFCNEKLEYEIKEK